MRPVSELWLTSSAAARVAARPAASPAPSASPPAEMLPGREELPYARCGSASRPPLAFAVGAPSPARLAPSKTAGSATPMPPRATTCPLRATAWSIPGVTTVRPPGATAARPPVAWIYAASPRGCTRWPGVRAEGRPPRRATSGVRPPARCVAATCPRPSACRLSPSVPRAAVAPAPRVLAPGSSLSWPVRCAAAICPRPSPKWRPRSLSLAAVLSNPCVSAPGSASPWPVRCVAAICARPSP
eukprot:351996-Chlamydomonas_euryale.AAC.1